MFFITAVLIAVLSFDAGFRLGERRKRSGSREPGEPLGAMVASTLGLLAFLMGFTFNIAVGRFDDRRIAVLDEANAIGTTYLRAEFLAAPHRDKVRQLLTKYVEVRRDGINQDKLKALTTSSQTIQEELWVEATAAAKENPSPITALFVNSLNEVIDLHSKRLTYGLHARVPAPVWMCLLLVSIFAMCGVGYYSGVIGKRSWIEPIVLISAYAIVILLVADLDRPKQGLIQTSQQPMLDLYSNLVAPESSQENQ